MPLTCLYWLNIVLKFYSSACGFCLVCAGLTTVAEAEPADRIYWSSLYGLIQHAHPDGTDRRFYDGFDSQVPSADGIFIDSVNDHIYWTDGIDHTIRRGNLDGSDTQILFQGDSNNEPIDVTVDMLTGKIYWVADRSHDIVRSDADGSNIEILFDGSFTDDVRKIAVDPMRGKIYWTDNRLGTIFQSNMDGSVRTPLIDLDGDDAISIAIDLVNDKLYWVRSRFAGFGEIQRSDLDGTNLESIVTSSTPGVDSPSRLAVDPIAEKLYWSEIDLRSIQRANLDGTSIETIVTAGASLIRDIALDQSIVFSPNQDAVPEPATLSLLALGGGWVLVRRSRHLRGQASSRWRAI